MGLGGLGGWRSLGGGGSSPDVLGHGVKLAGAHATFAQDGHSGVSIDMLEVLRTGRYDESGHVYGARTYQVLAVVRGCVAGGAMLGTGNDDGKRGVALPPC